MYFGSEEPFLICECQTNLKKIRFSEIVKTTKNVKVYKLQKMNRIILNRFKIIRIIFTGPNLHIYDSTYPVIISFADNSDVGFIPGGQLFNVY
jgi:hypothetical protein